MKNMKHLKFGSRDFLRRLANLWLLLRIKTPSPASQTIEAALGFSKALEPPFKGLLNIQQP
jgi:hypothetical protein